MIDRMKHKRVEQYIDEIDILIANHCDASNDSFGKWHINVFSFFKNNYPFSIEYENFKKIDFEKKRSTNASYWNESPPSRHEQEQICKEGLEVAKKILQKFLEDMTNTEAKAKAFMVEHEKKSNVLNNNFNNKKIFIVHGHDGELKGDVALFIQKQDIDAIILSNQANQGKTIIEKIEENSDVGCAVCLFTKDDIGKAKAEKENQFRARQNVVFETGYFYGKIGRDHTVIIYEDGVELPSDLQGIAYTKNGAWQMDLIRDLVKMGYDIDSKKI